MKLLANSVRFALVVAVAVTLSGCGSDDAVVIVHHDAPAYHPPTPEEYGVVHQYDSH